VPVDVVVNTHRRLTILEDFVHLTIVFLSLVNSPLHAPDHRLLVVRLGVHLIIDFLPVELEAGGVVCRRAVGALSVADV
jgi:hypothetical protein